MKLLLTLLISAGILSIACSNAPPPEAPANPDRPTENERAAPQSTKPSGPRVVTVEQVDARGSFLPPLPQAVTSFGAAVGHDEIVILGGYFGEPHEYSREGQSVDVLALPVSAERNGSANGSSQGQTKTKKEWTRIARLDRGLQGLAAVHYEGKACYFGGSHAKNEAGAETEMISVRDARCLDLETGAWQELPPLPAGRSSHGAALIGSTAYLVGGWELKGDPRKGHFATDIWSLDLSDPEADWSSIEAPFQRRALGVTSLGDQLVVVGGMTADRQLSTEVDVYDTQTKKWSKGARYPDDAFGIAVTAGPRPRQRTTNGSEPQAPQPAVFASGRDGMLRRWSPGAKQWETVRPLGLVRFFHEMRPLGNELVVLGGIGGMHTRGRTRVVERLPLDGRLAYGQLEFATPGLAKNRQGLLARGELIYLFGGNTSLGQHDFAPSNFTDAGWFLDLATLRFVEASPFPVRRQSMRTLNTDAGGLALGGFGHQTIQSKNQQPKEAQSGSPTGRAQKAPSGRSARESSGDSVETGDSGKTGESKGKTEKTTQAKTHADILSYSWDDDEWKHVGRLPSGRTQFGLTHGSEKLWIFGGLNYDPSRKQAFRHDRSIWIAEDPTDPAFSVADVDLPGPRRAFASAALDGKFYMVGGMEEGFQLVDDCKVFDFSSREFAEMPCPKEPRLSGDLISAKGKLYLVGGSVRTQEGIVESRNVDVYDPKTQEWDRIDFQIPFGTKHLRALPFRDQILLLSTHQKADRITVGLLSP